MNFKYSFIESSLLPPRLKRGLLQDMHYIEDNLPTGLVGMYLFGSIARQDFNHFSDIDLCIVFKDSVDLHSDEMRIFRGFLSGASDEAETDVVTLTESQLCSNSHRLYQEINRDKISLIESI